jgi:GDP-L-fucose synthase
MQTFIEFLHVDYAADALLHLMKVYSDAEHVNVGSQAELSILELAQKVAEVVGFEGKIDTDPSKPYGTPRKLMGADKLKALGWWPKIELSEGLAQTYRWYLGHVA